MLEELPPLPLPKFELVSVASDPGVPAHLRDRLQKVGVPIGLIGYEYRALESATHLSEVETGGVVAFGKSGLFGRICVDVETAAIVYISSERSLHSTYVNSDIDLFVQCVAAVIEEFPFYDEDDGDEEFTRAADDLKVMLAGIDGTALVHSGFWHAFCDDVAMGDYARWTAH